MKEKRTIYDVLKSWKKAHNLNLDFEKCEDDSLLFTKEDFLYFYHLVGGKEEFNFSDEVTHVKVENISVNNGNIDINFSSGYIEEK